MSGTEHAAVADHPQARRHDADIALGQIRKLVPSDRQIFLEHLLRLDPLSRFMRFGGVMADTALERHSKRAMSGEANIIGYFVDGELRAAAELHPLAVRPGKPLSAEAAFSVERAWQGKGIGSALMGQLVLIAQNRGIEDLQVVFLPNNGRMKRLAVQNAAALTLDSEEVVGHMRTPPATLFSQMREWIGDVFAVFISAAEIQERMLPPPMRGN